MDRIGVYWTSSGRVETVVKAPAGDLVRVDQSSVKRFQTNQSGLYDGYNSPEALVVDMA